MRLARPVTLDGGIRSGIGLPNSVFALVPLLWLHGPSGVLIRILRERTAIQRDGGQHRNYEYCNYCHSSLHS